MRGKNTAGTGSLSINHHHRKGGLMKHFLLIPIIVLALFAGCSSPKAPEVVTLKLESVIPADHITPNNTMFCIGRYKNDIYYAQAYADEFAIRFVNLKGEETNRFIIPNGQGPGEARHTLGVTVYNDKVYFNDFVLRRISTFSLDGQFLDSTSFGPDTGTIIGFSMKAGKMYYHSMNKTWLGIFSLEEGKTVASLPHPVESVPELNKPLQGGCIYADPYDDAIYIGHASKPYIIERYNEALDQTGTFHYNLEGRYGDAIVRQGPNIMGDLTVTSLFADEMMLYAPHLGARFDIKNNEPLLREYPVELFAFDKETMALKKIYRIPGLEKFKGGWSIVDVDLPRVILHLFGEGESMQPLTGEDMGEFARVIVVLTVDETDR